MLKLIEGYDIAPMSTARRPHLLTEAMKICWRERLERFGDPRFTEFDPSAELGDPLISELRSRLEDGLKSPQPGKIMTYEPISLTWTGT